MINHIFTNSPHMQVLGTGPSYVANGGQGAGQLRFNVDTLVYEVYNGVSWQSVSNNVYVDLNTEANQAIQWAIDRMRAEQQAKELAKSNPTVADAVDNLQRAQEQLAVVVELCDVS